MNREQRRSFGRKGSGKTLRAAQPVEITRQVPLTILGNADGISEVVQLDTAESCFACRCCAVWGRHLDELAGHIRRHHDEGHGQCSEGPLDGPCECAELVPDSCLVCALLSGQLNRQEAGA